MRELEGDGYNTRPTRGVEQAKLQRKRPSLGVLERRIQYAFKDRDLLRRALTHCSFANESPDDVVDNEALEFLGDAVLSFVVSDELCKRFPAFREGRLSRTKASMVQTSTLAALAREIGLGRYLLLGRGEEKSGGAGKESLLANAFEALIAAVYRDGGIRPTRAFIRRALKGPLHRAEDAERSLDPKSALQERLQAGGHGMPAYKVVEEHGPDHHKTFVVELRVGRRVLGTGEGRSKKVAQQKAARAALKRLASADGEAGKGRHAAEFSG